MSVCHITHVRARVLSRCVANPRVRAYFAVDEAELVVDAMEMTADELSHRIDQWIALMDEDGAEPHTPERDVVRANRVGDRVKIDGDLGLETGLPVLAALKERADQLYRRDQEASDVGSRCSSSTPTRRPSARAPATPTRCSS